MRPAPDDRQLSLGIALPAARSGRAELVDAAKKPGGRKKATGGPLKAWPALGEPVALAWRLEGPEGAVEAVLWGDFMGTDVDASDGTRTGRVRLAADQPGLTASLAASLPRQVGGARLGQLSRREGR